jgi:hypothetical protein
VAPPIAALISSLQLAVWDIVWRLQATMLLKRREFERAVVSCQKVRTWLCKRSQRATLQTTRMKAGAQCTAQCASCVVPDAERFVPFRGECCMRMAGCGLQALEIEPSNPNVLLMRGNRYI